MFESLGFFADLRFFFPCRWCGHCKKLAPIYDEVGEAFENEDTVTIAKMDATANDIPDPRFDVKGFPTLYMMTAAGEVKKYEGDRSKDSLIDFVKAASTASKGEAAHSEL